MESIKSPHFKEAKKNASKTTSLIYGIGCYFIYDLFGGPKVWKGSFIVNLIAVLDIFVFSFLMKFYDNYSPVVLIFFGLRISHGLLWFIKNHFFPDSSWEHKMTIAGGLFFFIFLAQYWSIGWYLVSNSSQPEYPLSTTAWYPLCIVTNFLGSMLLMTSDAQKFFTLKYNPGLITTGFYKKIRHPNYLGQMLVYISLLMLTWHWIPAVSILFIFIFVYGSNMAMKEASMSRYPGWMEYRKRTWWLLPGIL